MPCAWLMHLQYAEFVSSLWLACCHCIKCLCMCRRRGPDTEYGDDSSASLPRQCRSHNPALLATVPLHQHVAVQLRGPAAETAAVLT